MDNPVVTSLTLSPTHPEVRADVADLCRMHARVIDATVGMPDDEPRTLWAQPHRGVLVIRAPEPVTICRLPRAYATAVTHRPWVTPDRPGRWRMVAVVNPARHATVGGPTLADPHRKRLNAPPVLYGTPAEQAAWLQRRIDGATLLDYTATRAESVKGRHRTGRTITARRIAVSTVWQVDDPEAMRDRLTAGVGIDKTWGCGLTLWSPEAGS